MRQYLRFGWAATVGLAVGGTATAQLGGATTTGGGVGSNSSLQAPLTIGDNSAAQELSEKDARRRVGNLREGPS